MDKIKGCKVVFIAGEDNIIPEWKEKCLIRLKGRCCIDCSIICSHRCSHVLFYAKKEKLRCPYYLSDEEAFYKRLFK